MLALWPLPVGKHLTFVNVIILMYVTYSLHQGQLNPDCGQTLLPGIGNNTEEVPRCRSFVTSLDASLRTP